MLSLPLVVTLALAPTDTAARFDLFASAAIGTARVDTPVTVTSPSGDNVNGQAGAALDVFIERVVDDWTPPSLQPFLQRTALVYVDAGGGGARFSPDVVYGLPLQNQSRAYADVGASGYSFGFLYEAVNLGVRWFDWHDAAGQQLNSALSLPLNVRVGGRVADWLFFFGWGVTPTQPLNGTFSVPFWGGAFAGVDGVVAKRLHLSASVGAQDGGGASAGATGEIYLARRFGIGANVFGGATTANMVATHWAGFGVGFDAWMNAHVEGSVGYQFQWTEQAGANNETDWNSLVTLQMRYRR